MIKKQGNSLVVQWIRICLPMQATLVQSLVWEDSTSCGATKLSLCTTTTDPVLQSLQATTAEPASCSY